MRQKSRRETGSTPVGRLVEQQHLGVWISAQVSPSFCFMPPDSWPAQPIAERRHAGGGEQPRRALVALAPVDAEEVGVEAMFSSTVRSS